MEWILPGLGHAMTDAFGAALLRDVDAAVEAPGTADNPARGDQVHADASNGNGGFEAGQPEASVTGAGGRCRCAASPYCTTRRGNAHRTDDAEECEVLYPWHPWAGCIVRVHETVEKADGTVLRCSRDGKRGSAGWSCRRGCSIRPCACRCGSHAIPLASLGHWRSSGNCSPKRRAGTAGHHHRISRFRAQLVRFATRIRGMIMRCRGQRPAIAHRRVRQLDLFGLPPQRGSISRSRRGECCPTRRVGW